MFSNLGLGIRLNLEDNVSSRVDRVSREIDRLEDSAQRASGSMTEFSENVNRRQFRANQFQDMNRALKGTDYVLNDVNARFIRATQSARAFAEATGRIQVTAGFQRMLSDVSRAQRQIAMLGFGMSALQRQMSDTRAYNMMNYQMKELHERIALTRQGLVEMQNSPDSSQFVNEIAQARASLLAYEDQLARVNAQQLLARANGQRVTNIGGTDTLLNMPNSYFSQAKNKLVGLGMLDMGVMAQSAYNSINKTAKMMVGLGYTTMEARTEVTRLAGALNMVGMAMSQFVTLPLAIITGAMGVFAKKFEDAQNLFQARTLTPKVDMDMMGGWDDELADVWVRSGFEYGKVATTMSDLRLSLGNLPVTRIGELAEYGLRFEKTWGVDATESILASESIMKRFGVTSDQSLDILTLALREANGDLDTANKYINNNIGSLRKMTDAGKEGATAFERLSEALMNGGIGKFLVGVRQVGDVFRILWESGIDVFIGKLGDGLLYVGKGIENILQKTPGLAQFTAWTIAIGGTFLMLLGPVLLLTGLFVTFRSVIQGVSASIFGLSRGGLAVLSPQALIAKKNMDGFTVAIARLPQTLLSVIPLLYNFIRGLPALALNIIRINPLFGALTGAVIAYANNFGGFKDKVKDAIGVISDHWNRLEDMYKNSSLPAVFRSLKDHAVAFGEGVVEGFAGIVDIGKSVLEVVLYPMREIFRELKPFVIDTFNTIDKFFGGSGDAKSTGDIVDRLFGTADKWNSTGVIVGRVLAGLTTFFFLSKGFSAILTPFRSLAGIFRNIGNSISGITRKLPAIGTMGSVALRNVRNGAGTARDNAKDYVMGTNEGNPVVGTPNIIRRTINTVATPFTATQRFVADRLAGVGVGSGIAMGRERAEARSNGLALRDNPQLLSAIRDAGRGYNVTARGDYQGNQVYRSNQGVISRALTGQQMYQYVPVVGPNGQTTGYQRQNYARTGGILRPQSADAIQGNHSMLQRGISATTGFVSGAVGGTIARMSGRVGNIGSRIMTPIRATTGFVGRTYDRVTTSRPAQFLSRQGARVTQRLGMAGLSNPYAGATAGGSRLGQVGNFVRTGISGTAGLIAGSTMMAGRGAMSVGRGIGRTASTVGRVASAPLRGLARGAGGLMALAMNPATLAAGLLGYGAYKAFGGEKKDADGNITQKGSVKNIAGNMDKATANMLDGGDKKIKEFWDKFISIAKPIVASTGKLIGAALLSLVKAMPGIMRSVGNVLKGLAGLIKEGAIRGWEWMKTDGVFYFGLFVTWLSTEALPAVGNFISSVFGKAWNWVMDDGIRYLGMFITWLIGTAIPWTVGKVFGLFGMLWDWVADGGLTRFASFLGQLLIDIGTAALGLGKALLDGIVQGLSSLGSAIMNLLPSWDTIKNFVTGGEKGTGVKNSKNTKRYARGGLINHPHLGLVGEDGPEMIIPLGSNQRNRALSLLGQTASIFGLAKKKEDDSPASQVSRNYGMNANMGEAPVKNITSMFFINSKEEEPVRPTNNVFYLGNTNNETPVRQSVVINNNETPIRQMVAPSNNETPLRQTVALADAPVRQAPVLQAPVRTSGGNGANNSNTPQQVDSSLNIESLIVQFPESASGIGAEQGRQQALIMLKELQKMVKMSKLSGGREESLESLIMRL